MSENKKTETAIFVLAVAGVGCFLLSLFAMGLAPWTSLRHVTEPLKTNIANPYYDEAGELTAVGRGRKTYIKEGCWHCHSQFVRPVAGEPYRYGPASQAWESMYDVPHTFGTRRVGPDLSRQAGRHSDDWHFAHLYNPRITVPESIMPGYPWYFEEGSDGPIPKQEAKDLVAYLQYLGSSYKKEIQEIVYPKLFKVSGAPVAAEVSFQRGQILFQENCVGCHGKNGDGVSRAVAFLKPPAANLVDRYISASEAYSILNRGVLGSAMPSFREMPERDLWAIAGYVSSLGEKTRDKVIRSIKSTSVARGKRVYQANCSTCHGNSGGGDGPAALALNPRPKDFTRRLFERNYLNRILEDGIPGSAMPPFPQLSDSDRDSLYHYLASIYRKEL